MEMASLKTLMVLSVLCFVTRGDKIFPGPSDTSSSPIYSTTTKATTATISTSPITTTSYPTTTTTTTATTPPTTTKTSSAVTTSTSSPNTTTSAPNTTTSTVTTTTTKSTTPQPLIPGKWSVNYTTSNTTCLVLEAALQIIVFYKMNNKVNTYHVNVPSSALAEGYCYPKTEYITLQFDSVNTVTFNIQKSNDSNNYDVDSILITLNAELPNVTVTQFNLTHKKKEFSTPLSNSYKCAPEKSFNMTAVDKLADYTGELHISHFQIQGFRNSTNQKFDKALDCEGSETPDVVPIAVGCALAALVIIVLVAYLIGRRRSQARGYLSM